MYLRVKIASGNLQANKFDITRQCQKALFRERERKMTEKILLKEFKAAATGCVL